MELSAEEMRIFIEKNGKFLAEGNQRSILSTILLRGDPSCIYEDKEQSEVNIDLDKITDIDLLKQIYGIVSLRIERLKMGVLPTSRFRSSCFDI